MATPRKPELRHLASTISVGQRAGLVELRGLGGDLAGGEVARGVADQPLLFGQLEIHGVANLARRVARGNRVIGASSTRPGTSAARARSRGLGRTATGTPAPASRAHVEGVVAERRVERAVVHDALAEAGDLARPVGDGRARRRGACGRPRSGGGRRRRAPRRTRRAARPPGPRRAATRSRGPPRCRRPARARARVCTSRAAAPPARPGRRRRGRRSATSLRVQPAKHHVISSHIRSSG